ncbi:hypothetical protein EI42_02766 [Thermosporothrix hazakensis]|jgi:hypothetical protein|uniref:Uncharacterized protein n=2 Tax=Thermosporothrix TaxID=768650 RepID=A0A326U6I1_THEHA|nr:hypothetical protein [Thermosporothrix hazakensis]PZW29470.1 hypothetical protein EI42_02766 [Thermosporothrix hazakensis]
MDIVLDTVCTFDKVVNQFLAEYCEIGEDLRITDDELFHEFRQYWLQVTHDDHYPALLGQFRVYLTEHGYRSSSGKHPEWYGLTLRKR